MDTFAAQVVLNLYGNTLLPCLREGVFRLHYRCAFRASDEGISLGARESTLIVEVPLDIDYPCAGIHQSRFRNIKDVCPALNFLKAEFHFGRLNKCQKVLIIRVVRCQSRDVFTELWRIDANIF